MRTIQAPGIQTTELDRSGYADTTDNSIVNTASFFCGFTDKGIDYEKKYVNSMQTYEKMFGVPTNEAEKYLYNGVYETINRGGNAYVAKLPYDNDVIDKFSYVKYTVLSGLNILSSPYDIVSTSKVSGCYETFLKAMLYPSCQMSSDEKHTFNQLEFLENSKINLTAITETVQFIQDNLNLQYSTRDAVKQIFYKDEETCRNDSIYLLEYLQDSIETLCSMVDSETKTKISNYQTELSEIRNVIIESGNLSSQINLFVKSKQQKYYKDYIQYLQEQVRAKSNSYPTEQSAYIKIMDRFENDISSHSFTALKQLDDTLTSYMQISAYPQNSYSSDNQLISIEDYDKFKIGDTRPKCGDIQIIDISRRKYGNEANIIDKHNPKEYLGILPVITTPANALYVQKMIDDETNEFREYCAISDLQNIFSNDKFYDEETKTEVQVNCRLSNLNNDNTETIVGFTQNIGGETQADYIQETLSKTASKLFPTFIFENGHLERKYLKHIGVIVFEMFVDTANDNKIGFTPVEAYSGSLNRKDIDSETKASTFIDNIVNTNSSRINLFSNVQFTENQNVALKDTDKASLFLINNQTATSLGFYSKDTLKTISLETSILKALDRIFFNCKDINTFEFDLLVDAGVSNIAQFIKSVYGNTKGYFDLDNPKAYNFNLTSTESVKAWKQVMMKYDDLCKNVRKDCMFIADGPRPLCLNGNEKRVRNTKPENTIENTVLKDLKYITGHVNSSYGAGYCDWFYTTDKYSGDYFWCPPSIKANGVYIYTDAYSNYWDAPAGMNRGVMPSDVIDIAFNPTNEEAGKIYNVQWNYAISYPMNGIVQEGQRTYQKNRTALDRVNVRRLMLGLEKRVRYVAKYFTYEGITDYMMSRFRDSVSNILQDAKNKGGISEFYCVCDSRNNSVQTIENHELHCLIAIKPVLSLEFICLTFIATSQGANVQEVAESEL